jgi:hypothetical protein
MTHLKRIYKHSCFYQNNFGIFNKFSHMKKLALYLFAILLIGGLSTCKKPSAEVTGIIEGMIINSQTSEPIRGAIVTVGSASSKTTGDDGKFRFEGLEAKEYTIQVQAESFESNSKTIVAIAGSVIVADIPLTPMIPLLEVSVTTLNFGMSETILPLTITNSGKSTLEWSITENIPWLSVSPTSGTTGSQPSGINVLVERSGLTPRAYSQSFIINSNGGNLTVTVNMTVQGPVPTAILSVSPQSGTTNQFFQLDASSSTDDIDPASSLMARWRWEDNLDFTFWSTIKSGSYQYPTEGVKNITLEVKDSQGNIGTDLRSVTVNNSYSLPNLATNAVSNITTSSAVCGGNIYSDGGTTVSQRGVCWSINQFPEITNDHSSDGSGIGSFISNLSNLTSGSVYFVRAYAKNDIGINYGNQVFFTAGINLTPPSVTTGSLTVINTSSVICGGTVISNGTSPVTSRGVCWSINPNPTIYDFMTMDGNGLGTFQSNITGLVANSIYYIRAYAINQTGTSYGEELSFSTTPVIPILLTKSITEISAMGGLSGGQITNSGGGTISERGLCYSTSENPSIYDNKIAVGSTQLSFNASINNATPNTIYYIRSYAINEAGVGYGNQLSFQTSDAFFYSFESGILPGGWSGQWVISSENSYEGSNALKAGSVSGSSVSLSVDIQNPTNLYFDYYIGKDYSTGFPIETDLEFFIDQELYITYNSQYSQWVQASIPIGVGNHTFTWKVSTGFYNVCIGFLDYIVIPK